MCKILLVMTGGTIASVVSDNTIAPEKDKKPLVLDMFKEKYGEYGVDFTVKMPFLELSENMGAEHFQLMYDSLKEYDSDEYDGIVVTCGTDTLDYTSAVVGLTFANTNKSIAIVSSDKVLSDSTANGMSNFKNAVDFIKEGKYKGVYTFYTQNGQENVHIATRITPCLNFTDTVESVDTIRFGVMKNGVFEKEDTRDIVTSDKWKNVIFKFSDNVLFIKGYPSVNPVFFDFKTKKPDAVVYSLYHSSTASVKGDKSAMALCEKCKEYGVDFYVAPYRTREERYATDEVLINAGAKPLFDITETVALVKVMLAYGTFGSKKERDKFLNDTLFSEKVTNL